MNPELYYRSQISSSNCCNQTASANCFWWVSLVAQPVKNPPAMQETKVGSLGQEDPPEKGRAAHFSILAWEIPRAKEPGWATVHGVTRVGHDLATKPSPPIDFNGLSLLLLVSTFRTRKQILLANLEHFMGRQI